MESVAIIPARGGSKGVKHKNVKPLGGRPLITYTIETALKTACIGRTVVSTDDDRIAAVARGCGAEVRARPAALAQDDVPVLPVVQHLLAEMAGEGYRPDIAVVLQPTSPFRRGEDIQRAVQKLVDTGADCVISLSEAAQHPFRMRRLEGDRPLPLFEVDERVLYAQRQELPPVYMMDGAIYACRRDAVMGQAVFYGQDVRAIVIERASALDIDTTADFELAEWMMRGWAGE